MSPEDSFKAHFEAEGEKLGLRYSADVVERMSLHYGLMRQWGKKVNLTSIFDPAEAARLHGVDAMLFDAVLPEVGRIVDAGSGAGFPGVALAVRRPEVEVLLLEPIRKRCSFLRVVASKLGLRNLRIVEGRLEPSGARPDVGRFGGVVSRATWAPVEWVHLGVTLVEEGGLLVVSGARGAPDTETLDAAGREVGLRWQDRRRFRLGDAERVLDLLRLTA